MIVNLEAVPSAKPFRPFEIRVDRDVIVVRHPEEVFFAEKKATVIVDSGDRIHIMDTDQIAELTLLRN